MWRVRGRVPLAIDAHAQIVELQLMDEEVMREKKRRRRNIIREGRKRKPRAPTNERAPTQPP